ncbi:hypothetical protein ABZ249_04880 [Nocardiopsis sp. NPDC006139]|uniref:hypothetical protein n=1 Tax=unclassified Nocardiopsis TaxID=2649073 RepID=UPI001599CB80|nr:hypothetical protein HUT17_02285 [Nocardiopsis flavescens]
MADGEAGPLLKRGSAERARPPHGLPPGAGDGRDAEGSPMRDLGIRRRLKEVEESRTQAYIAGVGSSIRIDEHVERVRRDGEARVRAARARGAEAVRHARSEAEGLVERAEGTGRALVRDAENRALTLAPAEAAGHMRAARKEGERGVGLASAQGSALVDRARTDSTAEVRRIEAASAEASAEAEADAAAARPEVKAARADRLAELGRRKEALQGLLGARMPRGELRSLLREDRGRERASLAGFESRLAAAERRAGLSGAGGTAPAPAPASEAVVPGRRRPDAATGLRGAIARAYRGEAAPTPGGSPSRAGEQRSERRGHGV